jgi:mannose-6-phosphate isomerase-like protein (cupin superfamily)
MNKNRIISGYQPHPAYKGVYMKHFFDSEIDNRLNNLEVRIEPGHEINPHVHEGSHEFFYVVKGRGKFLVDDEWIHIRSGEALFAPKNVEHGFKNENNEPLILFSTFSPPIK